MNVTTIAEPIPRIPHDAAPIVPAIAVHGVSHSFGARKALQDVSLTGTGIALHRAAGAERRRQDDAVFSDHAGSL